MLDRTALVPASTAGEPIASPSGSAHRFIAGSRATPGLYVDCGDGMTYGAIRTTGRLNLVAGETSDWPDIYLHWSVPADRILVIDGVRFRGDDVAPIRHDGQRYRLPFPHCRALDVFLPTCRFSAGVPSETLWSDREEPIRWNEEGSDRTVSQARDADLNGDGAGDKLLPLTDRYGSGAAEYLAVYLGCGDDTFAYAGDIELGRRGDTPAQVAVVSGKRCGIATPVMVVTRRIPWSGGDPHKLPKGTETNRYRIDPKSATVAPVACVPRPH